MSRRWQVRPIDEDTDEEEGDTPYATRAEAMEAAIAESEPGETILVHADDCRPCSCVPITLRVPPRSVA